MLVPIKNSGAWRKIASTLLVMQETFITILPIYMIMSLLELASSLIPDDGNTNSTYGLIQLISFCRSAAVCGGYAAGLQIGAPSQT